MKHYIFTFLVTALTLPLFGQAFDSAVGLRFGYPTSVTYKKFFDDRAAGEAYIGLRSISGAPWLSVNAAYQIHDDLKIEGVQNLQWYYGAGAGFNSIGGEYIDGGVTFFNVAGYLGLSYVFDEIPLNLSLDWVPTIAFGSSLGNVGGFGFDYGALSARYILNN